MKEITWTGLNATGIQRVTINHYRHDGKLTQKELPNKEKFLYTYDNMGKLEKITYPDGKRTRMLYDINGNLIQTIDRRDLSTTMTYNDSDMVVEKKTVDTTRGDTVITTTYTQFGPAKILQKENNNDIVENNYWYHWSGGVLKQTQVIDTYTMQIDNTFDASGNQITTTPTGSGATPWTKQFDIKAIFHAITAPPYDTDNFNRTAVVDNATGNTIITYEPDFLGLAKNIKYGTYASYVAKMSYTYDKYLRVKRLLTDEGTPYLDITLTRDFIGNITRRQEPAQSPAPAIDYNYIYDGMNRLGSGEGDTNTYDELSNLVTKGTDKYVYQDIDEDDSDQMRLAKFNDGTDHEYTYDENGNPTEITNRFSSLAYDNLNMLRRIVHTQTDDYWYNSAGLRVKRKEDATGTPTTTYTLFDGDNPLMQEEYSGSTRISVTFNIIVGGKILAQYKRVYPSTDTLVYFYIDNLNSRRVVLDSAGTATDRYRYSAWGEATTDEGAGGYKSFTGKEYDATGLIYFNARYYDPLVGRFVTEDPSKKGTGWFSYCGNNPINTIDLKGLQEKRLDYSNNPNKPPTSYNVGNVKQDLIDNSRVFFTGANAAATIPGLSGGGSFGEYFIPKPGVDQLKYGLGVAAYTSARNTAITSSVSNPIISAVSALIAITMRSDLIANSIDYGVYASPIFGVGGTNLTAGFAGSATFETGTIDTLTHFKGLSQHTGASGGPPLVSIGGDIYQTYDDPYRPMVGKITGGDINFGVSFGAPAEVHWRISKTFTQSLVSQ